MNWFQRLFSGGSPNGSKGDAKPSAPKRSAQSEELLRRYGFMARPAVVLKPGTTDGFSRLGGLPDLPDSLEWPSWKGQPLGFLAQLDLATVHSALPSFLPKQGRLYFFFDSEQSAWGTEPDDRGAWRVLFAANDLAVRPRKAPEGLPREAVFESKPVTPVRIESLPDSSRLPKLEFDYSKDEEAYLALRNEPFGDGPAHQMLGFPSPVQSDDMEMECELLSRGLHPYKFEEEQRPDPVDLISGVEPWCLLLQLDSDNDTGWMWGDAGVLYFWVRESEAQVGDFSQVWMHFQCC